LKRRVPRKLLLGAAIVDSPTFKGTIIETGTDSYRLATQSNVRRSLCN
jgi:hypothetical protein